MHAKDVLFLRKVRCAVCHRELSVVYAISAVVLPVAQKKLSTAVRVNEFETLLLLI
jgi:hypothetical protein